MKYSREHVQFVLDRNGVDRSVVAREFNLQFNTQVKPRGIGHIREEWGPRPAIEDGLKYTVAQIRFVLDADGTDAEKAEKYNAHFGFQHGQKEGINARGVKHIRNRFGPAKPLPPPAGVGNVTTTAAQGQWPSYANNVHHPSGAHGQDHPSEQPEHEFSDPTNLKLSQRQQQQYHHHHQGSYYEQDEATYQPAGTSSYPNPGELMEYEAAGYHLENQPIGNWGTAEEVDAGDMTGEAVPEPGHHQGNAISVGSLKDIEFVDPRLRP